MKEKECNVVTLENGIEYTEIDRINDDNKTYVILSNADNPKDFCIRKLIKENNEDYIVGLDNDEEFDRIYDIFSKKYL